MNYIWSSYFKVENVIAVNIGRNQDVSLESFNDQFKSVTKIYLKHALGKEISCTFLHDHKLYPTIANTFVSVQSWLISVLLPRAIAKAYNLTIQWNVS